MTQLTIKKATRARVKIKIFLAGPSGSGKTDGALALARNFAGPEARIVVIDTERESASYYADRYDFDTIALDAPYSTDRYVAALELAVAEGYDVVIIDSITHQWSGVGGILERKEQLDARPNSNSFVNWGKFTPETERFRNALLEAPVHLIACCRAKQEYVMGEGGGGNKRKVEKMGLKPEQRDGLEYEFGVALQLQMDHKAEATKDRTNLFEGKVTDLRDVKVGRALRAWLDSGVAMAPEPARVQASTAAPMDAAPAKRAEVPATPAPSEPTIEQLLELAKTSTLMGRPDSWDNHGGKPLGECPDKVLKAAQRFFRDKVTERANARMEEQLQFISLILAEREKNSPQESLPLAGERTAPTPRVETVGPVPESAKQEAERVLAGAGADLPPRAWAPGADATLPAALVDDVDDLPF